MKNDAQHNPKKSKVGLYSTLIFHLVVLIVLLLGSFRAVIAPETTFVLDFSKQEEREKEKEVELFKESVSKQLDEMLAQASSNQSRVRNVAVNAGEKLKDDRHKNTSSVYNDARELQKKLDAAKNKSKALDKQDAENYAAMQRQAEQQESNATPYSGPSVLSWRLDGRGASSLPVPAYKGYGAGNVAVKIYVNRKGRVVKAVVVEGASSSDRSLQEYAVAAAKRSRFTSSETADDPQIGEIVYTFIAQ